MRFSEFPPGQQREVDSRFHGGKYLCFVVRYAVECSLSPLQRFRSLSSKLASGRNGNPLSNLKLNGNFGTFFQIHFSKVFRANTKDYFSICYTTHFLIMNHKTKIINFSEQFSLLKKTRLTYIC